MRRGFQPRAQRSLGPKQPRAQSSLRLKAASGSTQPRAQRSLRLNAASGSSSLGLKAASGLSSLGLKRKVVGGAATTAQAIESRVACVRVVAVQGEVHRSRCTGCTGCAACSVFCRLPRVTTILLLHRVAAVAARGEAETRRGEESRQRAPCAVERRNFSCYASGEV